MTRADTRRYIETARAAEDAKDFGRAAIYWHLASMVSNETREGQYNLNADRCLELRGY